MQQSPNTEQQQGQHQVSPSEQTSIIGTILKVPTFRHATSTVTRRSDEPPLSKEQDPFLYFSNRDRRIAHLLSLGEQQDDEEVEPIGNIDTDVTLIEEERSQRISFEVYPGLLYLQDLISEVHDEVEGSLGRAD